MLIIVVFFIYIEAYKIGREKVIYGAKKWCRFRWKREMPMVDVPSFNKGKNVWFFNFPCVLRFGDREESITKCISSIKLSFQCIFLWLIVCPRDNIWGCQYLYAFIFSFCVPLLIAQKMVLCLHCLKAPISCCNHIKKLFFNTDKSNI